jgi:hypothetical protein
VELATQLPSVSLSVGSDNSSLIFFHRTSSCALVAAALSANGQRNRQLHPKARSRGVSGSAGFGWITPGLHLVCAWSATPVSEPDRDRVLICERSCP